MHPKQTPNTRTRTHAHTHTYTHAANSKSHDTRSLTYFMLRPLPEAAVSTTFPHSSRWSSSACSTAAPPTALTHSAAAPRVPCAAHMASRPAGSSPRPPPDPAVSAAAAAAQGPGAASWSPPAGPDACVTPARGVPCGMPVEPGLTAAHYVKRPTLGGTIRPSLSPVTGQRLGDSDKRPVTSRHVTSRHVIRATPMHSQSSQLDANQSFGVTGPSLSLSLHTPTPLLKSRVTCTVPEAPDSLSASLSHSDTASSRRSVLPVMFARIAAPLH